MEDQQPAAGDLTDDAAAETPEAKVTKVTKEAQGDDAAEQDETVPAATEVASDEVDGAAAEQLDVGLGSPAERGRVDPGREPGDGTGGAQPVDPPLDRGRGQPHLRADLSVRGTGVVDQRGDNPLVQLIEGHAQILPPGDLARPATT